MFRTKVLIVTSESNVFMRCVNALRGTGITMVVAGSCTSARSLFKSSTSGFEAIAISEDIDGAKNAQKLAHELRDSYAGPMIGVSPDTDTTGESRKGLLDYGCNYTATESELPDKIRELLEIKTE